MKNKVHFPAEHPLTRIIKKDGWIRGTVPRLT